MSRSLSKSAVKRKAPKRENREILEEMSHTYHSNPPFKPSDHKS